MKRIAVLALLILLFFIPVPVHASSSEPAWHTSQFNLLISDFTEALLGKYDSSGKLVSEGAVNFFAKNIDTMVYTPPASFNDYAQYLGNKFHIPGTPKAAYAAGPGIGYNALTPILPFWTTMRNVAYFCFAIFFVIAGIMIMIRSKIDPKTAVTIQSILPKIVLTLVVVTFSYAIAGFIVDIMYIGIALVLTVAQAISDPAAAAASGKIADKIANENLLSMFLGPGQLVTINAAGAVTQVVSNFFRGTFAEAGGALAGLFVGSIAMLIIAIAIVWALLHTWLILLNAYANALLAIILAPVQLMFDAIPGQNQLEGWVRGLLANLLVFPAVIAMIFLATALSTLSDYKLGDGFVPPLIGGNSQPAIQALIGLAILLTIPKSLEILQQILKAPQNKWGNAWGEAIGFGRGLVTAGAAGGYGSGRDILFGEAAASGQKKEKDWRSRSVPTKPVITPQEKIGMTLGAKPRG